MKRSHTWTTGAAAAALLIALTGCSPSADSASPSESGLALPDGLAAEAGTDIPAVTMKVGLTPLADEIIPVIGERLGFFEEAGISFSAPNGIQANLFDGWTPLLNGQIEVGSGFVPLLDPQRDTVTNLRSFADSNVFQGYRILVPAGEYETVSALMDSGASYDDAVREALAQLQGQTLLMEDGGDPAFVNIALKQADLTLADTDATYLSNADIVLAAESGKADFAAPGGAVQIAQLQTAGWVPLIDLPTLLENTPSDETSTLRGMFSGYIVTTAYAEQNYNSLLRFAGVIYRIIDALEADPVAAAAVYSDYVNSYTGASLTDEQIAALFAEDGPYGLVGFDEAASVFDDTDATHSVQATTDARLANYLAQGVLTAEYTASDVSIADRIYHDLVEYRDEAQKLLDEAPDGELKSQAEALMQNRNYLDAYRFAKAAAAEQG